MECKNNQLLEIPNNQFILGIDYEKTSFNSDFFKKIFIFKIDHVLIKIYNDNKNKIGFDKKELALFPLT